MIDNGALLTEESFASVLLAARQGAEWAWSRIYRQLAPVVLGYLRAQGAREPEDLAGEVFAQAVRDLTKFDGDEGSFRSWIFVIAHHRLLDEARSGARHPSEPATEQMLETAASPGGDVEAEAMRNIASERVRRLIDGLSADQRSVLLLRIIGGLTVEETAAAVNKRPGAVKALQRRGLDALRKQISVTP